MGIRKGMLLGLLTICAALAGCGTETPVAEGETTKTEGEPVQIQMTTEQGDSYGKVCAFDEKDKVLWEYETPEYEPTELARVGEIGWREDAYYLVQDGSVVALDAGTGEVLWENDEFQGAGFSSTFGRDSIYLCGYYGPDFYEISYDGETLKKIQQFDEQYFWACGLEDHGEQVVVTMDGGSETGEAVQVEVDKESYEYEILE